MFHSELIKTKRIPKSISLYFSKYVENELFDDIFNRRRVAPASWKMHSPSLSLGLAAREELNH